MNSSQLVTAKTKNALGLGYFSMFFVNQGFWVLALPFYQMTLGLDPFLLSLAATIPVLVATAIGPWVGHLSDHSRSKYGRRKPFILLSCLLTGLIYGLIWSVPFDWPQHYQFTYLFILSCLFYLTSTFFVVPLTCMTFETTKDEKERTRVLAVTTLFTKFASAMYQWAFPISQLAIFGGAYAGVQIVGWFIAIFIIALLGLAPVIWVKESEPVVPKKKTSIKLSQSVLLAIKNKKLLILLVITFVQIGLAGYAASMDYYLIVYYMFQGDIAEGAFWKGVLSTAYAITGIVSVPIVAKLAIHYGRQATLKYVFLLTAVGGLVKWYLFVPGVHWLIIMDVLFCGFIWVSVAIIVPALIADLCDAEEEQTGDDHKGAFIAVHNWVANVSGALALILSGLTLNFIGFDANQGAMQSEYSLLSMRGVLVTGTVIASLLGWYFIQGYEKRSEYFSRA